MGFHGAWLQGFRRWVLVPPDERPPFGCRSAPCDDDSDRTSTSGSSAPRGPTDRRVEHVVTWVTRKLGTCRSKKARCFFFTTIPGVVSLPISEEVTFAANMVGVGMELARC